MSALCQHEESVQSSEHHQSQGPGGSAVHLHQGIIASVLMCVVTVFMEFFFPCFVLEDCKSDLYVELVRSKPKVYF